MNGSRWIRPTAFAVLAIAGGVGACDTSTTLPPVDTSDCVVAVVSSDYRSASISLLDGRGVLCADNIIHSGSADPGLGIALSGDVVLPSRPSEDGGLWLVDRYPNGVATRVSVEDQVVSSQIALHTGFGANPQDLHWRPDDVLWVPRAETNPAPSADPDDLDEGGDILMVRGGLPVARLDLSSWADDGYLPRPGQLARVGDSVMVGLNNLTPDFQRGGAGVILELRADADGLPVVSASWRAEGLSNCGTGIAATPDGAGLWLTCTGVFPEGEAAQVARSGLLYLDMGAEAPTLWSMGAAQLGGRPMAFQIAPLSHDEAVVVASGNSSGQPDRLLLVDRRGRTAIELATAGAFELGALLWLDVEGILLFADADPRAPKIRRLERRPDGSWRVLEPVDANPSVGLPPRDIKPFRLAPVSLVP